MYYLKFKIEIYYSMHCIYYIEIYFEGNKLAPKKLPTQTKSMAMWGNHIQRVNTVMNDNII